jgi:phospholipid/cholesterol/gamma-HCH transport system ATP-binding protein
MITVKNVEKFFQDKQVLSDVTFSLAPGEFVGLFGPSGSGKSVLLKILGNFLSPDAGEITFGSEMEVGFLFQEGALFDSLSVIENVAFPLLEQPDKIGNLSTKSEIFERAFAILEQVGLKAAYNKVPGQLSGGMRRRVGIARALISNPALVLLDDPTGGLDPVAATVMIDLIKALHAEYQPTVVLVSHDIRRLIPSVTRMIGLFDGEIACDMPTAELKAKAGEEVLKFLSTRYDFS